MESKGPRVFFMAHLGGNDGIPTLVAINEFPKGFKVIDLGEKVKQNYLYQCFVWILTLRIRLYVLSERD